MKKDFDIPPPPPAAAASGVDLDELKYIFFRHKWKILAVFLVGLVGAGGFYKLNPPAYQTEATIFIKYIQQSSPMTPVPGAPSDQRIQSPDMRGETIMNTQVGILTSFDLASDVAEIVGPEKILGQAGGGSNRLQAAAVVRNGLLVDAGKSSSIIRLVFSHRDPAIVQPVLSQLIASYQKKHVEIYRPGGWLDDFFSRKADEYRARLAATESELKRLKAGAEIVSLDDNKYYSDRRNRIEQDLLAAEAELAEQQATLDAFEKLRPGKPTAEKIERGVPPDVAEKYRLVSAELEVFQKRQSDLRLRFKDEHPQARQLSQEISRVEAQKHGLEEQYTNLSHLTPSVTLFAPKGETDLTTQVLRASALQAKIRFLTNELATVRAKEGRFSNIEPEITKLQRQLASDQASFNFYTSGLERQRIEEAASGGKVTNIDVLQNPTPSSRDLKKLMKPLAAILAFALFGGFALAFLIEKVLNQNLKRVQDLERLLPSPVFVSVPDLNWKGDRLQKLLDHAQPATNGQPMALLNGQPDKQAAAAAHGASASNGHATLAGLQPVDRAKVAPWDSRHILRSYYEGLRDRLITYFEVRNLTHKPKLVAVTSCRHGAGVTTMAAGLAATLSETGDGNVLLVDMNLEHGAAHQFYQGKPGCALTDALENSTRETAQVQENLYLVSVHETKSEKLPRALPKRFSHLIPRMKASDYDYIIFDMPPITQTSVTPRLAGLMDMVLLVVESETTGQKLVKRAHDLLGESRATVATVLNKHRDYIPERFGQEL